jgi:hypothetical protein
VALSANFLRKTGCRWYYLYPAYPAGGFTRKKQRRKSLKEAVDADEKPLALATRLLFHTSAKRL